MNILKPTLLASMPLLAMQAMAQSPQKMAEIPPVNGEWVTQDITLNVIRGYGKRDGTEAYGEYLYVFGQNGPGDIVFSCMDSRLMMGISTGETSAAEALLDAWDRPKFRQTNVKVKANGKIAVAKDKWLHQRRTDIIIPASENTTRHFYNMVVRHDDVLVDARGETYAILMPKPNRAFINWGADCGMSRIEKNSPINDKD